MRTLRGLSKNLEMVATVANSVSSRASSMIELLGSEDKKYVGHWKLPQWQLYHELAS